MKLFIYEELQEAFDFYNTELFKGELPQCIINLIRQEKSFGYFYPNRFVDTRGKGIYQHVIAMNSEYFGVRELDFTLSTLVHEMVHAWTFEKNVYGRAHYHNKWWAKKMKEIGLTPTDTGEEGGRETGQNVTHRIVRGGLFDKCTQKLIGRGFKLPFVENNLEAVTMYSDEEAAKKVERLDEDKYRIENEVKEGRVIRAADNKIAFVEKNAIRRENKGMRYRYSCGKHNVWGKPGLSLFCEECNKKMVMTAMYGVTGERWEDDNEGEDQ
jgi:predicted SprT family Zn-dependent metalloprotease